MRYAQGFSQHFSRYQLWGSRVCLKLQRLAAAGASRFYLNLPYFWRNYLRRGRWFLLGSSGLLVEVLPPAVPPKRILYNPFAVIRRWLGAPEKPALIIDVIATEVLSQMSESLSKRQE
ncbi:MAG: hypothetical protein HC886_01145 [Leptolyngbyaceae cyanobacterium SM1_1_3]|nr:hypothetical protein [Leptolyngbyaceae cyanobacterium SM1_1_3]NJM85432.1 hypothetical protein [Leptolyngbyaceae cyanobacterium RM2_2_21]NJN03856.1 hypothetical protein [Leptolyngbyaceae cyanobacterium RM1_1_2]NJO10015.1 hypothetical protein [Leptolyngbyaceae cyanobacterium SL_1_1]